MDFDFVVQCHGQRRIHHVPTKCDVIGCNNFASWIIAGMHIWRWKSCASLVGRGRSVILYYFGIRQNGKIRLLQEFYFILFYFIANGEVARVVVCLRVSYMLSDAMHNSSWTPGHWMFLLSTSTRDRIISQTVLLNLAGWAIHIKLVKTLCICVCVDVNQRISAYRR